MTPARLRRPARPGQRESEREAPDVLMLIHRTADGPDHAGYQDRVQFVVESAAQLGQADVRLDGCLTLAAVRYDKMTTTLPPLVQAVHALFHPVLFPALPVRF